MSQYDLDTVFSRAEVPDVARQLGLEVQQRGVSLLAKCPFHSDTRPSLVLYPGQGGQPSHFHCFACNAHGYAIDLVKQVRDLDFKQAVEWLAGSLGISPKHVTASTKRPEQADHEDARAFANGVFDRVHVEGDFAAWCPLRGFDRDYLYGQGLRCLPFGSPLTHALRSEKLGRQQALIDGFLALGLVVRLRPKARGDGQTLLDLTEQFRDFLHDGRILIPIRSDRGDVIGFAGRSIRVAGKSEKPEFEPPKYLVTPGFKRAEVLFNHYQANQLLRNSVKPGGAPQSVYLVEGFLDALRLHALRIPAVAMMGSSLSEGQRSRLVSLLEEVSLEPGSAARLRLFFDRDNAGFEGVVKTSRQMLGTLGVIIEWIGLPSTQSTLQGKDVDEMLSGLSRQEALEELDRLAIPAIATLLVASLGYKDASPLSEDRWEAIASYARERALLQVVRTLRAVSGAATNWAQRLQTLPGHQPKWIRELVALLHPDGPKPTGATLSTPRELAFLRGMEARLNHSRMLAEYGSRRGELPCDEESWRALDRNARLFNQLAQYRLKQNAWHQVAPCDAIHLPRKLTADQKVLDDPRRKVMPHAADLHLQQFLLNELLTERHDFSHAGPRSFSDCIPAVRWFGTEEDSRLTGFIASSNPDSASPDSTADELTEPILSFAYQIDMEVIEGRKRPSDQGMFRPYIQCWRAFMDSLKRQASQLGPQVHVLRLDAKRYYDSIQRFVVRDQLLEPIEQALNIVGPDELSSLLGMANADSKQVAIRVVDLICGALFNHEFQHPEDGSARESEKVIGIPQGPVISAWIGTIAMFPVDAAARSFMQKSTQQSTDVAGPQRSVGYARYVDDIVLMSNSEERLNELREVVQAAAARLGITLVRKGEPVASGSPEYVLRQLNGGRLLAMSVPAWEPPMVGDGETGWGIGIEEAELIDRQSALHLLRHPALLEDPESVHEKVREAMRAKDLRTSDLGKCARALWWQAAIQSSAQLSSGGKDAWAFVWQAYFRLWHEASSDHAWQKAFQERGHDVLFAVEGLDMLMDSNFAVEKRRPQVWIDEHRKALRNLARAFLNSDDQLAGVRPIQNRQHIARRLLKVQWKAMQRLPGEKVGPYEDPQVKSDSTLTAWLCHAAIALRRYHLKSPEDLTPPLAPLLNISNSSFFQGPPEVLAASRYLISGAKSAQPAGQTLDNGVVEIALSFLVANTTEECRRQVLTLYPDLLISGLEKSGETLKILPPIPIEGAGMLAFIQSNVMQGVRLLSFRASGDQSPSNYAPGATLVNDLAAKISPLSLTWDSMRELAPGLCRWEGKERALGLAFDGVSPNSRARFAADLYEVLLAIQDQPAPDQEEWVTTFAHVAHDKMVGTVTRVEGQNWYLVSEPIKSGHLGVVAWVRDGRGGLRSISVPGGEHARLWRLGCAVSDALGMASDLPQDQESGDFEDADLKHPNQIEEYVLRQQLAKLRGSWLAEAQIVDVGDDRLPKTIRRSLDLLRSFNEQLSLEKQARLVCYSEAETRSMAMRLERKGPGDLRDRLHLLPHAVLMKLPLNILELLVLGSNLHGGGLRTDLEMMLAIAGCWNGRPLDISAPPNDTLGSAHALHIGASLAAVAIALRGLTASAWGVDRQRAAALPKRFSIPAAWPQPELGRTDPQESYSDVCERLSNDDWSGLNRISPWAWMLGLLGLLNELAPQALESTEGNPLFAVYEHLRRWEMSPADDSLPARWAWPYDGMPAYEPQSWTTLLSRLPDAAKYVDGHLGWVVKQVYAPVYRRSRDDPSFTDADSQQWIMAKVQFTGLGSGDSVASVEEGGRRNPTWSEVRKKGNGDLLSVHTLDHKLGRWLLLGRTISPSATEHEAIFDPASLIDDSAPLQTPPVSDDAPASLPAMAPSVIQPDSSNANHTARSGFLYARRASWRKRRELKSPAHMRVALLQWSIEESYSHPLSEVGLNGLKLKERDLAFLRKHLRPEGSIAEADNAGVRGKEFSWTGTKAVPSWPEHRRRRFLKGALEACADLGVELLVLPELSVRPETVKWLEDELEKHYPGMAVLAGTYRHFGPAADLYGNPSATGVVQQLTAPMVMLWRPSDKQAASLFAGSKATSKTLRFSRGKKYRAVAANELFRPHGGVLEPLFRVTPLLKQLDGWKAMSLLQQEELIRAIAEDLPPLRYCMELICSELFLLTSPANLQPLRNEIDAMLRMFSIPAGGAEEIVLDDFINVGRVISVLHDHRTPRRTILLVPAATKRNNDYWHAGQASVLASGTATVFCNAANPKLFCGGSCFIGIDSASKPHPSVTGIVETTTPYHGWQKGLLTSRLAGALSTEDQALVVADIDPVHVVTGRPRPQLLPEPMSLVAYLPIVELLDQEANKVALQQFLAKPGIDQIDPKKAAEVQAALSTLASAPHAPTILPNEFWTRFGALESSNASDGPSLDTFAEQFGDPKAVSERLKAWLRDRHHQPQPNPANINRAPAWLDFLEIDLTLRENQILPELVVPPWKFEP